MCATHPHRWLDLTRYKLFTIQPRKWRSIPVVFTGPQRQRHPQTTIFGSVHHGLFFDRGPKNCYGHICVANGYRNLAIHPQNCPQGCPLGIKWRDKFYVDMTLPFGLCSAPYIFKFIADMVQGMLTHNHGVDFLRHYALPDFPTWVKCRQMLIVGIVGTWSASQVSPSIAYKELFPIVVAAYLWGPHCGLHGGSSSYATVSQWCLYCLLVPPETRTYPFLAKKHTV